MTIIHQQREVMNGLTMKEHCLQYSWMVTNIALKGVISDGGPPAAGRDVARRYFLLPGLGTP